jgi:hypothetical protein
MQKRILGDEHPTTITSADKLPLFLESAKLLADLQKMRVRSALDTGLMALFFLALVSEVQQVELSYGYIMLSNLTTWPLFI